jgi:uncharacterized FlaG/YvyC family protein
MKIEGAFAAAAAVSTQALASESPALQRDRAQVETARIQSANPGDANAVSGAQRAVGARLLSTAVESVERLLGELDDKVRIRVQADGRRLVVVVFDHESGRTLRELPAERFIDMVDAFERQLAGLFIDERQ